MKRIILSGLISVLFCTWAPAESSVWKAEKDGSIIYLGGTCHLLRPSDFPLPPEFDTAYSLSDMLVFETDLLELQSPETQQKLMASAMYMDGSTIDQHLSPETYALLAEYGANNGLPIESLKAFKPGMIAMTLTMMELMKAGITQEGVDLQFHKRATQDQKPISFLETVDEQIAYVTQIGEGNEDAVIKSTINEMHKLTELFDDLISAWKGGDEDKINTLMNESISEFPDLYEKLLTGRNRKWMPQIEAYQKTPTKEFILVGAAHLVGPDGVLKMLKQNGFSVEKVQSSKADKSPSTK